VLHSRGIAGAIQAFRIQWNGGISLKSITQMRHRHYSLIKNVNLCFNCKQAGEQASNFNKCLMGKEEMETKFRFLLCCAEQFQQKQPQIKSKSIIKYSLKYGFRA